MKHTLLKWFLPIGLAAAIAIIAVAGAGVVMNRIAVSNQSLAETNEKLTEELKAYREAAEEEKAAEEKSADTFSYLAIGNSITQHPVIDDFWWGEWGMAATDAEHDYYHLVCDEIAERYDHSETQVLNFRIWEEPPYNREDMLKYLKGYVTEDLDLITVMLGDNIDQDEDESDDEYRSKNASDYKDLIRYLKEAAPNAEIVLIGCFWEDTLLDLAMQTACEENEVPFIGLYEIQGDDYRAGQWAEVEGADDTDHIILGTGAAEHPNDKAMRYIADRIIEKLPE